MNTIHITNWSAMRCNDISRLAAFISATTLLFSAWAQNQTTLTPIGKWPEYPLPLALGYPVGVAGSHVYLAGRAPRPPQGSSEMATLQLLKLDVSSPSQPRYLGHVDTLTDLEGWDSLGGARMLIRGAYAYVTLAGWDPLLSMLAVFSLSEAAVPRLVGTLRLSGLHPTGINVVGDHAYVSAVPRELPQGRLLVIDVSDPAHPTLRTTASLASLSYCVSVAGDYAYVGGQLLPYGARVDVIDISDPGQATVVGGFDLPEYDFGATAIAAEGSLLHCGFYDTSPGSFYRVFDLTDPLNPVPIGYCEYHQGTWVQSIRVVGTLVYVTHEGLSIIDISDPHNPQRRGWVDLVQTGACRLDVADHVAYLREAGQLRVLDVTDPAAPVQVGQFDTGFSGASSGPLVSLDGDIVCLLDGPRLRVLNVSNPRAPTLAAAKDLEPFGGHFHARGLKVVGHRAYLVGWDGQIQQNFLRILDLSDPSHPVEVGRGPVLGGQIWLSGVDVVGGRAYVSGYRLDPWAGWLAVLDISHPAAPTELGQLSLSDSAGPPQAAGDFAYSILGDYDLAIIDVRNPSQMVEVGRYHSTNALRGFQVVGRYAYILVGSDIEQSLHVVDLADPTNPTRVGRYLYDPGTLIWPSVYVSGGYTFVTFRPGWTEGTSLDIRQVDVLDVRAPIRPVKIGEYDAEGRISAMAMAGNTLYTTSDTGLTVLDFYAPNTSPNLRLNAPVLSGGVAVLTWEGGPGIKLQKTTSLSTPNWQDVPGTTGQSLAILPQADAAFFRLTMPLTKP